VQEAGAVHRVGALERDCESATMVALGVARLSPSPSVSATSAPPGLDVQPRVVDGLGEGVDDVIGRAVALVQPSGA